MPGAVVKCLPDIAFNLSIKLFHWYIDSLYHDMKNNESNMPLLSTSDVFISNNEDEKYEEKERGSNSILNKVVESCVQTLSKMLEIVETSDLRTSMDLLKDAYTISLGNLSDANLEQFKDFIKESYKKARSAKNHIESDPNHYLMVYSLLIVNGFWIFSNFGENYIDGLKEIRILLKELNSDNILTKLLKASLTSKLFWTPSEELLLRNTLIFSSKLTCMIHDIRLMIDKKKELDDYYNNFNNNNADIINTNNMIQKWKIMNLFSIGKVNDHENIKNLLDIYTWCPNMFDGKFFGCNTYYGTLDISLYESFYPKNEIIQSSILKYFGMKNLLLESWKNLCKRSLQRAWEQAWKPYEQTWKQAWKQVWTQDQTFILALKQTLKKTLKQALKQEWNQTLKQALAQAWDQVWNQIWTKIATQVWDQIWTQIWTQIWDLVWTQERDQEWDLVWDEIWTQVWKQVWSQVWTQAMKQQVSIQVVEAVWKKTWKKNLQQTLNQVLKQNLKLQLKQNLQQTWEQVFTI